MVDMGIKDTKDTNRATSRVDTALTGVPRLMEVLNRTLNDVPKLMNSTSRIRLPSIVRTRRPRIRKPRLRLLLSEFELFL